MRLIFSFLLSALACANAEASDGKKAALIRTHGYVSPQFQAVWRPDARPVDQSRIGMTKSKAGLIFDGKVSPTGSSCVVGGDLQCPHSRTTVDENNDGSTDSVPPSRRPSGTWWSVHRPKSDPSPAGELGRMRIPFAAGSNTDLMFPGAQYPAAFIKGSDMGVVMSDLFDGRLKGSVVCSTAPRPTR